jgi:hypothetical protein
MHHKPAGLYQRENLHQDPIIRDLSELLITKSLTNGNNMRRPAPLANCDFKVSAMEELTVAPYSMPCILGGSDLGSGYLYRYDTTSQTGGTVVGRTLWSGPTATT